MEKFVLRGTRTIRISWHHYHNFSKIVILADYTVNLMPYFKSTILHRGALTHMPTHNIKSFCDNTIHYSVDFPRWFDRNFCSPVCAVTKFDRIHFFVRSQSAIMNFCYLTSFSFWYHHFTDCSGTNLQINLEVKRILKFFFLLLLYFLLYLLQVKSFSPWMAGFN